MDIIKALVDIAISEGIELEDELDFRCNLAKAWNEGHFKFIEKDGKQIGWIAWEPWSCEEGTAVFIHSLLILKKYKPYNLHCFVSFLREKYPDIFKIYWHNEAKNERKEFVLPKRKEVLV